MLSDNNNLSHFCLSPDSLPSSVTFPLQNPSLEKQGNKPGLHYNTQIQQKLSQPEKIWSLLKVDVAIFRDLDSRASAREVAAVHEWLQSKHVFHLMRDHPAHDMPILAGMWGVKLSSLSTRKALRAMFYQMLHADSAYWRGGIISSRDQALLERYLYPWAKDIALQHDSYHCALFAKSHAWPTGRQVNQPNNYVGSPVALNSTLSTPCPLKCRPRAHPEWNLCWKYSLHSKYRLVDGGKPICLGIVIYCPKFP